MLLEYKRRGQIALNAVGFVVYRREMAVDSEEPGWMEAEER